MIRVVTIGALLCLLVLVLALPAAHPAERFLAQMGAEHQAMAAYWGDEPALRILSRALTLHDSAREATPVPSAKDAPSPNAVDGAVAQEMASVNHRLFNNSYFRSIDAQVQLAAYRLSTLLEWLPWLAAFTTAVMADGLVTRLIKSKEFRQHDPELFALYACLAIAALCGAVVGFVVPVMLHPLLMPGLPLLVSVLLSRAMASFHRRGI